MAPKPPLRIVAPRKEPPKAVIDFDSPQADQYLSGGRGPSATESPVAAVVAPPAPVVETVASVASEAPAPTVEPTPAPQAEQPPVAAPARRPRTVASKTTAPKAAARPPAPAPAPTASTGRSRPVVIKLSEKHSDMLGEIAEERLGHKSTVAVEILEAALPALAAAHERGERPRFASIDKVGTDRRSLSLQLPAHVADALDRIAEIRGAVKHQVLLRVLLPGIEALHAEEIGGA